MLFKTRQYIINISIIIIGLFVLFKFVSYSQYSIYINIIRSAKSKQPNSNQSRKVTDNILNNHFFISNRNSDDKLYSKIITEVNNTSILAIILIISSIFVLISSYVIFIIQDNSLRKETNTIQELASWRKLLDSSNYRLFDN